jgi:putative DNA primase/helicase
MAKRSALKLSGSGNDAKSISNELLEDIHAAFEDAKVDRFSTTDLIKELCADEEKPWATYNRGWPLKPAQVAKRLGEYKIHSKTIRIGTTTAKGYTLEQFTEIFDRYLCTPPSTDVTTSQVSIHGHLQGFKKVTQGGLVTSEKVCESPPNKGCDLVTFPAGGVGEGVCEEEENPFP